MTIDSKTSLLAKAGVSVKKLKIILLAGSVISLTAASPLVYFKLWQRKQDHLAPKENPIDAIGDVEGNVLENLKEPEEPYVMKESFFGKVIAEEQAGFDPSPPPAMAKQKPSPVPSEKFFTEPEVKAAPPVRKPKIKKITNPNPGQGVGRGDEVIDYSSDQESNKGSVIELLADKDYPRTIATPPHDLSRMVTTDTFIPAVMYTAVNSEIPSRTVLAVVESDVFGFHGSNILIPKGSKLEGVYEKLDDKHARRMQITWFKITRPDGIIIKIDAESADAAGASGISGYLDQRLKDRYGGAILLSTINGLAQMSVRQNDIRQLAAVESFGREFGTLTAQIIRENINILPIIMIPQGQRFNIRPYQNIYFPEPKNKSTLTAFFTN